MAHRKKFSSVTSNYVRRLGKGKIPVPQLPRDYPWKLLSAVQNDLASYLDSDEEALLTQIIRDRDFDAYLQLDDVWGLQKINVLPPELYSSDQNSAKYQLASLIKKFQFPSDKTLRQEAAFEKFEAAEEQCFAFNATGFNALCSGSEFTADVLTYARGFLLKLLGDSCPTKEILTRWSRHGPGANLDTSKNSGIYFKYDQWPYSCTQRALPYAQFLIATDKRWLGALEDSYRTRFKIPKYRILNQQKFWEDVFNVVEGNKIAFVPKSAVIDRTIAIEPSMNLMLQLGVDGYIRSRLKRFGLDLDSQKVNRDMAELGSLVDSNDSFVTLDLAAASDTISLKVCEMLLPPNWYDYLLKLRSPTGTISGKKFSYEKISSMGCGYTFVLESAIFAALVYAAHKAANYDCVFSEDAIVYGDDIICRKGPSSFVLKALNLGGFKINTDKSFFEGPCRESCGSDWLMGRDIRPISVKTLPASAPELFVDRNRLKRYMALMFGITNSHVVQLLDSWIPPKLKGVRGPYSNESFDSYLHSTVDEVRFSLYGNESTTKSAVRWKYGYWFFPILVTRARRHVPFIKYFGKSIRNPHNFLFRKLMHDLSPDVRSLGWKSDLKRTSSSSRFTVMRSHSATVGASSSETSYWSSDYSLT
jgi:hypothetical protein